MGVLLMIAQSVYNYVDLALIELFWVLMAAWLERHKGWSPLPIPRLVRATLFSTGLHRRAGNWAVAADLEEATP